MNLSDYKTVHFTGIKGVGMTALACIGLDYGWHVTGSDVADEFVTDAVLVKKGIQPFTGFRSENIEKTLPDMVVHTVAHRGDRNPEVQKALELAIPVYSQIGTLSAFFRLKKHRVAVAGVGGKTTTSAMLSTVLTSARKNPSYFIGSGPVPSLDFPGRYDSKGDIFIAEADEYGTNGQAKFLSMEPSVILLTNLAYDHPDLYESPEKTIETFRRFIHKLPPNGCIIANIDSPMIATLLQDIDTPCITYSTQGKGDAAIIQTSNNSFTLDYRGIKNTYSIPVNGTMNIRNATAVIVVSQKLGLTNDEITRGLLQFHGTSRRQETVYQEGSTVVVDDYAHHPDEVQSTLESLKARYPHKKIIAVFQPHTYSRTKALLNQFSESFIGASIVFLTDIFASAREVNDGSITSKTLAEATARHTLCHYIQGKKELCDTLSQKELEDTIIVTMGAGDIYTWCPDIIQTVKSYYGRQ